MPGQQAQEPLGFRKMTPDMQPSTSYSGSPCAKAFPTPSQTKGSRRIPHQAKVSGGPPSY